MVLLLPIAAYAGTGEENQVAIEAGQTLRQLEWLTAKCGIDVSKDEIIATMTKVLANTTWGRHGYETEQQALSGLEKLHGLDVVCSALKSKR